jgi:repressor LexA
VSTEQLNAPSRLALDREVLAVIVDSLQQRGFPPSVRDLAQAVDVPSTSTMHAILHRVANRGWIQVHPRLARGLVVTAEGLAEL